MSYHVACGMAGIYAGTVKPTKDGKPTEWRSKSLVTEEAMDAVAQHMLDKIKASPKFKETKGVQKVACTWDIIGGGKMRLICEYEPPEEKADEA